MTMDKRGISAIVVIQTLIYHLLKVPNRQGNYPFTYLMTWIFYKVNLLKGLLPWRLATSSQWQMIACVIANAKMPLFFIVLTFDG